jgi:hypothetical protein
VISVGFWSGFSEAVLREKSIYKDLCIYYGLSEIYVVFPIGSRGFLLVSSRDPL